MVKALVVWLLIALIAIVGGMGEGLHSLPGCGHALRVGNRTVLLGVELPESRRVAGRAEVAEGPRAHGPHDEPDIPVYDEDLCPICSSVGKVYFSTNGVQFVLTIPLIQLPPVTFHRDVNNTRGRLFQARAPPVV